MIRSGVFQQSDRIVRLQSSVVFENPANKDEETKEDAEVEIGSCAVFHCLLT